MTRRKKAHHAMQLATAADLGPRHLHRRGELEVVHGPDPDQPNRTVRRARRVVHYLAMDLTDPQREAADRLCVQAERASGAGWRPGGMHLARPLWQRGHPTEAQIAALADLRRAREALGAVAWLLVETVIIRNVAVDRLAERRGESRHVLRGRLLAALDRLVELWRLA